MVKSDRVSDRILLNAGKVSQVSCRRFSIHFQHGKSFNSQQKYRERGVSMGGKIQLDSYLQVPCVWSCDLEKIGGGRSARPCVLVDFCCFFCFCLLVTLQVRHTEMVLDRGRVGSLNLKLLIKQCKCPTQAIEVKNGNGIEAGAMSGWITHLRVMSGSQPMNLSR